MSQAWIKNFSANRTVTGQLSNPIRIAKHYLHYLAYHHKILNMSFCIALKTIYGLIILNIRIKPLHSTDVFVYALTECIECLVGRSTSIHVAFLDASRTFHKNSHWTLSKKID